MGETEHREVKAQMFVPSFIQEFTSRLCFFLARVTLEWSVVLNGLGLSSEEVSKFHSQGSHKDMLE